MFSKNAKTGFLEKIRKNSKKFEKKRSKTFQKNYFMYKFHVCLRIVQNHDDNLKDKTILLTLKHPPFIIITSL